MRELGGFIASFVVFGAAGALVLQLAQADHEEEGGLRTRSAVALFLLAFFHANTVLSAAFTPLARVDALPRVPLLVLGLAVSVAGWALFIAATLTLVRRGAFEGLETTRLVTTGPYARLAHPQSVGWTVMLLGVAIASRSIIGLVLVGVFALFATRFARLEDRRLREHFGSALERHRARVAT